MNDLLRDAFRHNAWASRELLAFCRRLTPEQLRATTPGTYGSIVDTLNHHINWDPAYLPRDRVERPEWAGDDAIVEDLNVLASRVDESARLWDAYLSADPLDADHKLLLDQGAYEVSAGVLVVQALHHGTVHREQVCSIITSLGLEPPDLQAWTYAEATGRAREVTPS
jgi:uncharacterized damage-inducible protein DinB